jgi:hypothetical protein
MHFEVNMPLSEQPSSGTKGSVPRPALDQRRPAPAAPPPNPPLLHRLLGAGLVVIALAFVGFTGLGSAPLRPVDTLTPLLAYVFSGFALGLVAVVLVVFKPRVPRRESGQALAEYWSQPQVGAAVSLVWFLLEGAGVIASVGYGLTGAPVSGVAVALAVATYWLCGPNHFANS